MCGEVLRSFRSGLFEGKASDLTSTALPLKTAVKAVGSTAFWDGRGVRQGHGNPMVYVVLKRRPLELGTHSAFLRS